MYDWFNETRSCEIWLNFYVYRYTISYNFSNFIVIFQPLLFNLRTKIVNNKCHDVVIVIFNQFPSENIKLLKLINILALLNKL